MHYPNFCGRLGLLLAVLGCCEIQVSDFALGPLRGASRNAGHAMARLTLLMPLARRDKETGTDLFINPGYLG